MTLDQLDVADVVARVGQSLAPRFGLLDQFPFDADHVASLEKVQTLVALHENLARVAP
jgi:hypothetical protein